MSQQFDHIMPVLRELHWLPIRKRIVYKLAAMIYKCTGVHGLWHLVIWLLTMFLSPHWRADDILGLLSPAHRLSRCHWSKNNTCHNEVCSRRSQNM